MTTHQNRGISNSHPGVLDYSLAMAKALVFQVNVMPTLRGTWRGSHRLMNRHPFHLKKKYKTNQDTGTRVWDTSNRSKPSPLTPCVLELKTTGKLSRTYKGCWNDVCVCAQSARHSSIVLLKPNLSFSLCSGETRNCFVIYFGWWDRHEVLQG